jgi:DNA-binding transcriptional MerR regulator
MNSSTELAGNPGEKLYTIGTVSKLTGIGAITLRAWERRYGLIQPVRKDSGHRLYTRRHIDQINRITALTQKGMRISQIRPEMLASEAAAAVEGGPDADHWRDYLNGMLAAIIAFDEERLEEFYNEALSLYPIGLVTRRLLTPLLVELGLRWEGEGDGVVAEEHFFAFYLRNKLGARYHHRPRGNPARCSCWPACPASTTNSACCCSPWPPTNRATGYFLWGPTCRWPGFGRWRARSTARRSYCPARSSLRRRRSRASCRNW